MFGICNLSIVPIRFEASDRSEQVSQLLFGEHFTILEQEKKWTKIKIAFDNYIGWIDNKQYIQINEEQFNYLNNSPIVLNNDLIEYISTPNNILTPIPLGASLSFLENEQINTSNFTFDGVKICGKKKKAILLIQHLCT